MPSKVEKAVLHAVREGVHSLDDLAAKTKIARGTVSAAARRLLDHGILEGGLESYTVEQERWMFYWPKGIDGKKK